MLQTDRKVIASEPCNSLTLRINMGTKPRGYSPSSVALESMEVSFHHKYKAKVAFMGGKETWLHASYTTTPTVSSFNRLMRVLEEYEGAKETEHYWAGDIARGCGSFFESSWDVSRE
jgi:hypothetical protein